MRLTDPAAAYVLGLMLGLAACSSGGSSVSASGSSASSPVPTVAASGSASASADSPAPSSSPAAADADAVQITKCAADDSGGVTVEGFVTNTTGRRVQNLNVVFEIVDPSGIRLDTVFGSVELLAAGQRARFYTNSTSPITGKFSCRLLQVAAG
jgi:hypothetical protein